VTFDPDQFHRSAVQTPSHEDVSAMRTLLVETLTAEGHDPVIDEVGNVIVTRGSAGTDGTHLVLNTHMDTVRGKSERHVFGFQPEFRVPLDNRTDRFLPLRFD